MAVQTVFAFHLQWHHLMTTCSKKERLSTSRLRVLVSSICAKLTSLNTNFNTYTRTAAQVLFYKVKTFTCNSSGIWLLKGHHNMFVNDAQIDILARTRPTEFGKSYQILKFSNSWKSDVHYPLEIESRNTQEMPLLELSESHFSRSKLSILKPIMLKRQHVKYWVSENMKTTDWKMSQKRILIKTFHEDPKRHQQLTWNHHHRTNLRKGRTKRTKIPQTLHTTGVPKWQQ